MRISHTLLILSMIALDLMENQIVINALIIFQKLKKKDRELPKETPALKGSIKETRRKN